MNEVDMVGSFEADRKWRDENCRGGVGLVRPVMLRCGAADKVGIVAVRRCMLRYVR